MISTRLIYFGICLCSTAYCQSVSSGTVSGIVSDPSGAVVANAKTELHNPVTGYDQFATANSAGSFRFTNIPPDAYQLSASVGGFATTRQHVDARKGSPSPLISPSHSLPATRPSTSKRAAA
jgi:hypothetical protein